MEEIRALKEEAEAASRAGKSKQAYATLRIAQQKADEVSTQVAMAIVLQAYANVYQIDDRLVDCVESAEKAARIYDSLGDTLEAAKARTIQIYALGMQSKMEEAVALANAIRPVFENLPIGCAMIDANLAKGYIRADEYKSAIIPLQRSIKIYLELGEIWASSQLLHDLGVAHHHLGDHVTARIHYNEAYSKLVNLEDFDTAIKSLFSLVELDVANGKPQDALANIRDARQQAVRFVHQSNAAHVDLTEAKVRHMLHQYSEADDLLDKAAQKFSALGLIDEVIDTLIERSVNLAYSRSANQIDTALTHLQNAEDEARKIGNEVKKNTVLLQKAELYLLNERFSEAESVSRAAYEFFQNESLDKVAAQAFLVYADAIHERDAEQSKTVYQEILDNMASLNPQLEARCWRGIGRCAAKDGNLESLENAYRTAIELLDNIRKTLYSHENQAGFSVSTKSLIEELLFYIIELNATNHMIYYWVEFSKARALSEMLNQQIAKSVQHEEAKQLREQRDTLRRQADQISADLLTWSPITASEINLAQQKYADNLKLINQEIQVIDEKLTIFNQTNDREEHQIATLQDIQTCLDESVALLSFFEMKKHVGLLLITNQEVIIERLVTERDVLRHELNQTLRELTSRRKLSRLKARLSILWSKLFGSIDTIISAFSSLIIIPHETLFGFPIAALFDNTNEQFLYQTHQLQIVNSCTLWRIGQTREIGRERPLLLGYSAETSASTYLPHVHKEVEAIYQFFPEAEKFLEEDASLYTWHNEAAGSKFIHLATHIDFVTHAPLLSGILFANDEWLRAIDLYHDQKYLNGALVVLSGCYSGQHRLQGGEPLGLTSSLFYAGAKAVIATLWRVDDEATYLFMKDFYSWLSQDKSVSDALRLSMDKLRQNESYEHPYFWAAFALFGNDFIFTEVC